MLVGYLFGVIFVYVSQGGCSLLFLGDIGCVGDLLMLLFQILLVVDIVFIEFIYGNWLYLVEDVQVWFVQVLCMIFKCGGLVLLLSFVVGCVQVLLLVL